LLSFDVGQSATEWVSGQWETPESAASL